jgi:UDP-N-acetylmuramate--alanine ligase
VESDESDGSFAELFPMYGIITNIDKEHILHYGSFDNLKVAFRVFLNNLPFYGAGIVCIDDDNIMEVVGGIIDRKIVTYGTSETADFRVINIRKHSGGSIFDVWYGEGVIKDVEIPLMGDHNILNALAAIAVSKNLYLDDDIIKNTLKSFMGVKRRFTKVGTIYNITVIDDYAHHPTEIRTLLSAARQRSDGKVVIICQPHRFTRLNTLFSEFCNCFDGADKIVIVPVYKADDTECGQVNSADLYDDLKRQSKDVMFANNRVEVQNVLQNMLLDRSLIEGDIILFAGAGDISKWAAEIVSNIGTKL